MIGRHARLVVLCIFALSLALQAASTATEKVIYRFSGSGRDGYGPISKLVMDASGRLFGTTQYGGDPTCRCGTVFELTAPDANGNRKYLLLHDLKGGNDGRIPVGDLVMDSQGNLYGIAQQDGFYGSGVAFRLSPLVNGQWKWTIIHAFNPATEGSSPDSAFFIDATGNLYGTMPYVGPMPSGRFIS